MRDPRETAPPPPPSGGSTGGLRPGDRLAALLLLAAAASLPVEAATLELPADAGAPPAASVQVDLTIDDAGGILGTDLVLLHDPDVVTASLVVTTALSAGHTLTFNLSPAGQIRIALFGSLPLAGAGALLEIDLTAVGPPGSFSPLDFVAAEINEGAIPATVAHGGFCVEGLAAEVAGLEADLTGGTSAFLTWDPHPWAAGYNVYRGSDPALTDFSCHAAGVPAPSFLDDGTAPPAGGMFAFLVTAVTCTGDSSAGTTSAGAGRILPAACP